jgi:outer membrane protein assembly factor BamA
VLRSGLAICMAVVACGPTARPRRAGEQYLSEIRIEGNHAIPSDALLGGLLLHRRAEAGRAVDEYQLATDTERVRGAYEKLGFFAVDVRSRVDHHGEAETAVITVIEGPRARWKVEIDGLPPDVPLARARALIDAPDGAPFDYGAYDAAKAPLLRLIEDAGYAHARLDAEVIADRAHQLAIARYVLDAGPSCRFGTISIAGADGALADAVLARLAFHEGDKYSTAAIASTQEALYRMRRFSSVRVDPDVTGDGAVIAVKIGVAEGTHHELSLGGGLGLDPVNYSARGRATYTQTGWPFALSTVGLDLRPAYTILRESCTLSQVLDCPGDPRVRLLGTFSQQDVLLPDVRADVETGADYLTVEAYTIVGLHARLSLSTPLGTPRVVVRAGYLIAVNEFRDIQIDQVTAQRIGVGPSVVERISTLNQSLVVDLRDHPIEPTLGAYAELRITEGLLLGGEYRYTQVTPELRGYAPLGSLVLAARLRAGQIFGDVPPTERYFAGGASSHRGYPERQLSPFGLGPKGEQLVIGGAAMFETGLELRAPIGFAHLGAVAFLDGGNVTETPSQLSVDDLHWAVGLGLRWLGLELGPVGGGFAYRFGRDDPALPAVTRLQWFISIGEAY